ncbi:MAG: hypothetical protein J3K34DRAFT_64451 [Monoraphidium minutum]|nr:MAG: hypothetical protein J3K34DRAFT_64451 [Monoraphidium minutum]
MQVSRHAQPVGCPERPQPEFRVRADDEGGRPVRAPARRRRASNRATALACPKQFIDNVVPVPHTAHTTYMRSFSSASRRPALVPPGRQAPMQSPASCGFSQQLQGDSMAALGVRGKGRVGARRPWPRKPLHAQLQGVPKKRQDRRLSKSAARRLRRRRAARRGRQLLAHLPWSGHGGSRAAAPMRVAAPRSPTLLDCPPAPLNTTADIIAAADPATAAAEAEARASFGLDIWERLEADVNNYSSPDQQQQHSADFHHHQQQQQHVAPSPAVSAASAAPCSLALCGDGDSGDEPGWDDPELEALAAQWHLHQAEAVRQQAAAAALGLRCAGGDGDSDSGDEPGWDDPELEALTAQWHAQQALLRQQQQWQQQAWQAGGAAPSL